MDNLEGKNICTGNHRPMEETVFVTVGSSLPIASSRRFTLLKPAAGPIHSRQEGKGTVGGQSLEEGFGRPSCGASRT